MFRPYFGLEGDISPQIEVDIIIMEFMPNSIEVKVADSDQFFVLMPPQTFEEFKAEASIIFEYTLDQLIEMYRLMYTYNDREQDAEIGSEMTYIAAL